MVYQVLIRLALHSEMNFLVRLLLPSTSVLMPCGDFLHGSGLAATTGGSGLEITEGNLYGYLCSLRAAGRGATSGESVLQAIRFFHSILIFVDFDMVADVSARVCGVARQMFLTKRLLKQARALYTSELKAFENAVLDEKQPHVVAIAGYLLFCSMAVCRFADPMFCTGMHVSRFRNTVLIEAGTSIHKTAQSSEKKTMLLPLMALGSIFRSDASWAEKWFHTLQREFGNYKKPYILPAYSEQLNRWLIRPMTSAEGILWLRDLVQLRCLTGSELTTHSLKATLLSWTTIFNVLDFQQRRILGHHVDTGLASPLTYGRDNLTPLQALVHAMIRKIADGSWDPDLSRVQRLDIECDIESTCDDLDQDHENVVYGPHQQQSLDVDDMELALQTDEKVDEVSQDGKVFIAAANADGRIMQHNISGVLPFVGLEEKFVCGRPISRLYGMVDVDLSHEWAVWQQCRRIMGEDAINSYVEP
eukprot:s3318_g15.t1